MKKGDEVWVRAVVTQVKGEKVSVALRVANRVGTTWAGSSTTNRLIDGVVRRVTEVPAADVVTRFEQERLQHPLREFTPKMIEAV